MIFISICIFLFSSTSVFSSQDEFQRKFIFPQGISTFEEIIKQGQPIANFSHQLHSTYNYSDIYLDTKNFLLEKNKLSLRFRKRVFPNNEIEYSVQLKSEQAGSLEARMEIEEDDLSFLKVKQAKQWTPLTDLLGNYFQISHLAQTPIKAHNILKKNNPVFSQWIKMKIGSALAPFQKLNHLFPNQQDELKTLMPVLVGDLKRARIHFYMNPSQARSRGISKISKPGLPTFFKENPKFIWTMEASIDQAHFFKIYPKLSFESFKINELEVENKYPIEDIGKRMYLEIEKELTTSHKAQVALDSKDKQAFKYFFKRVY